MPRGKPSKGRCRYCGAEIAKHVVTKHLSACIRRQEVIEQAERLRLDPAALSASRQE